MACNGTVLLLNTPERIHIFGMKDGKRIKTHGLSRHQRWFCSKKNLLFYSDYNNNYSYLRHYEVEGFKQKVVTAKKKRLPRLPIILDSIKGDILSELEDVPTKEREPLKLLERLIKDTHEANLGESPPSGE